MKDTFQLEALPLPPWQPLRLADLLVCQDNSRVIDAALKTAAERDRLKEINAELLDALIAITNESVCLQSEIVEQARAAIAKATNQQ